MKRRSFFLAWLAIIAITPCFGQITLIETGTTTTLTQIERIGDFTIINGLDRYIAKCKGDCDELQPLDFPALQGYSNEGLNLIDTNVMYVVSLHFPNHTQVYKTEDGGKTWKVKFDTIGAHYNLLKMFDANDGILFGGLYRGLHTRDGWDSWEEQENYFIAMTSADVYGDSTVCKGMLEQFCISYNRGKTWLCDGFIQSNPRDIFLLNNDTVLAVSSGPKGQIFSYTVNSGDDWTHKSTMPHAFEPYGVYPKSLNEIYVLGYIGKEGIVIKTEDLGESWQQFSTGIESALIDMKFINDSVALVAGSAGTLFRLNVITAFPAVSGVKETEVVSIGPSLYPNPTTSSQTISLHLPQPEHLEVSLLDLSGRHISTVHKGYAGAGLWQKSISLENLQSGCYLLRISTSNETRTLKVVRY